MTTKEKILETLCEIPEGKLEELLTMVEDFRNKNAPVKMPGKWARFAGILTGEQAEALLAVIQETCERVEDD